MQKKKKKKLFERDEEKIDTSRKMKDIIFRKEDGQIEKFPRS